jgi:predicted DNA-binding transcriptional regulator AlpA
MSTVEESVKTRVGPVVVTARQLAIMLQVSKRTLWRMRSAGQLPSPMRVGGIVRWRLDEIQKWITEGCPARPTRESV